MGVVGETSYKPQLILISSREEKQVQCPDNSSVLPDICYVLLNVILNC